MSNFLAISTLKYIWTHPNCKDQRIQRVLSFLGWQLRKRILKKPLDIEIIPKLKIRCYPNGYSAASVLYCGLYDYNEMIFLLRYLQPEDSFLDIGANVGVYSLLAASKISVGKIYSFEALPKNYGRLEENIKLNSFDQVKSYSIAVSDTEGSIALNLAEGDSMPFVSSDFDNENSIIVATNTLDNLLEDKPLKQLTLAKIDIEGAELLAFKGATSLLKQQLPYVWILELNNTINHFEHTEDEVVNFLRNFGYELYSYDADSNQLQMITPNQKEGNNVLAIASSRLDFVRERLG
ncbi:FkbM family methyltransferase [Leptolyngbyaceae cyanobacterium CCMR0082]|uniref:FkbM family methyltransferase n=1 Tax=Adonisia turfae CCMR0082 TaxID=2304604 RepID=A0A6M0SCV0_9CYAN|nr:FkbM family methyltransferase [Adonisia turfae]NEZ65801.1 FkbM family methyltransferase [Adonisia turfae CCMR0082]